MEKLELVGLDATLYKETFENGFSIYMIPLKDKKNYTLTYATRYGSDIIEFDTKDGKRKKVPTGIAHFLEHKMFEQEDGKDPFTFFGESGTDANAATDHTYTKYICNGTKNFKENFRFLLQYVNSPYFTEENVEKEKGIIEEELNMYLDIPEFVLENKIRENLYQKHPRRIDVGGTVEDIKKITKEDLYDCYNTFYQPNNMFALLVGNFNVEEALQIAKEEISSRQNIVNKWPTGRNYHEPIEVTKKEETLTMNISAPKVLFAIKFLRKKFPIRDKHIQNLYLQLITSVLFGSSSLFREEARKEGLMSGMYYSWEEVEETINLIFQVETKKPVEFLNALKSTLSNIKIDESDLERYKKVWIANEVRLFDYTDAITDNIFGDIISYMEPVTNRISLIRKMNKHDLEKTIAQFKVEHITELIALPKEE